MRLLENRPSETSLETSIPLASLESILCTEELLGRPKRPPNYNTENAALAALVSALADSPGTILQTLADKVLEILDADSAGLSLLTKDEKRFYWAAIAGAWQPHTGGGTPRDFGPCGDVLDRNIPMLFTHWERRYPYLSSAIPLAEEGLLVPFFANGRSVGTIWAIAHNARRKFDAEDLRMLESMGHFASAAYQAVQSIEDLKLQVAARERAQTELRGLTDNLEAQVRIRTNELAARNEELRRSEAFLAEAQRLSSIGSYSWRAATEQITWSDELYRIYQLDPPVTLDRIRTRVHPEDVALFDKMVDQARRGGNDFEWQYRLLMPDQSIKYLHSIAHATRDQRGQLEYIAAVQDVTERRLSEEALDKARSELARVATTMSLGMLTASIAHEVSQPLAGIITNAGTCLRMLNAKPPNVEGARETTRRTLRDGNRASEVLARLRALFSKRDATTKHIDLNEATREVIALSLSELQRKRVHLRTELVDDLPVVTGDRMQLQQVIMNLVRNASDAMSTVNDRPRDLLIRTERENDCVRLTVKDVGVGFSPETANRLFQSFYTTKSDGMGIGLSISQSIIKNHQGRLWATPNEGPGTTFAFSIPHGSDFVLNLPIFSGEPTAAE